MGSDAMTEQSQLAADARRVQVWTDRRIRRSHACLDQTHDVLVQTAALLAASRATLGATRATLTQERRPPGAGEIAARGLLFLSPRRL